jgi:hypothetical protein
MCIYIFFVLSEGIMLNIIQSVYVSEFQNRMIMIHNWQEIAGCENAPSSIDFFFFVAASALLIVGVKVFAI